MKTRVLVGVVCVPLIVLLVLFAPAWLFGAVWGLVSAIAVWELLNCVRPDMPKRMIIYAAVGAILLPLITGLGYFVIAERFVLWLLVFVMFGELMLSFGKEQKLSLEHVTAVLFAGFILPMLFTSMVRVDMMDNGKLLLLMVFIVAFASDSFAYFAGMFLGKHKLAPALSPKKTIEGSAGGFIGTIACMMLYGLFLKSTGMTVNFVVIAIYGFLGSLAGQLGDLSFSAIKRLHDIKDYGNLIPGHGGVLDRFDSMLFVAPVIEIILNFVR